MHLRLGKNTLKSAGWLTLSHLMGLYVLILLIPFFSQGIYRMSESDLLGPSSETYSRGLLLWELWTIIGIPLLAVLTAVFVADWNLSGGFRKFAKLGILVLAAILVLLHLSFYPVMGAWVMD